ncbi:hypothetical protein M5K25_024235 [Dendrobium thyrsiflorum]|uniref:Uncharacterized protein n=1 Tax=Dendrobium thyrsiflorum TaxID=117978 RepID=A0ABD0U1D1_DENTH
MKKMRMIENILIWEMIIMEMSLFAYELAWRRNPSFDTKKSMENSILCWPVIVICLGPFGGRLVVRWWVDRTPTSIGGQVKVRRNFRPQVVVRQNFEPQVVVRCNSRRHVVVRRNFGPQVVVRQNSGPQVVVRQNSGLQVMVRRNFGPQMVVQQNSGPQVVVRYNSGCRVVVRQNSGPQVVVLQNSRLQVVVRPRYDVSRWFDGAPAISGGSAKLWAVVDEARRLERLLSSDISQEYRSQRAMEVKVGVKGLLYNVILCGSDPPGIDHTVIEMHISRIKDLIDILLGCLTYPRLYVRAVLSDTFKIPYQTAPVLSMWNRAPFNSSNNIYTYVSPSGAINILPSVVFSAAAAVEGPPVAG